MERSVHFVTVATNDVALSHRFYTEGLGWEPLLHVRGEIVFYQVAPGTVLGFFAEAGFLDDVHGAAGVTAARGGFSLAHNVGSAAEVDELLRAAVAAGGRLVKDGQHTEWGGYHGHFADPTGTLWEVAHNPGWSIAADGSVELRTTSAD